MVKKKKVEKRRLKNIEPYGVDLVDTPAIKKKFLVIKRDTSAGIILEDDLVLVAKKREDVEDSDLVVVSKEIQEKEESDEGTEEKTLLERLTSCTLDYSDDVSQETRDKLAATIHSITGEKPKEKEEDIKPEEIKDENKIPKEDEKSKEEINQPVAQTGEAGEAEVVGDPPESDDSTEPTDEEIQEYMDQKVDEKVEALSAQYE